MKKLTIFLLLLACSLTAGAQNRFSANFKLYDSKSGDQAVISGVVYVQDKCYRAESSDGFVMGDGTTRWIFYAKSEELVIQDDDPSIFNKLTLVKAGSGTATVKYADYTASLTDMKLLKEELPSVFFNSDVRMKDKNVIVTDLRD